MGKNKVKINLSNKTTMLSAIRTSLSFVRTALACVSVAFAFIKLDKAHPVDAFTVTLFVLCAFFVAGAVLVLAVTDAQIKSLESKQNVQAQINSPLQND